MQPEYVLNPKWVDADHTCIDMVVKFAHLEVEVPFTASLNDTEEHGRLIFAKALEGSYGEIEECQAILTQSVADGNVPLACEPLQ
jgi:hypothetical protein